MNFEDLGLSEELLNAIKDCGYTEPTPIQAQAIPHILMVRDVVGVAQTGTGKTASFTLPMIEMLAGGRAKARMPRSLILSPTRELAAQIAENFDTYGKNQGLTKALLVGGTSMGDQIKLLERGVDVLIATPGRLLDLFERGKILLTDIKILVIDEADRMLDMGFIPDIEKIVGFLSPMRQTLLFSATMPPAIRQLTKKFLSNPREVSVAPPASTARNVEQFLVWTQPRQKQGKLAEIVKSENVQNAFIFCNRKRDIDGLAKFLKKEGYSVDALHGDLSQEHRTKTLQAFKDDKITLLVCSDVAARGLDVDDVSHVFNYDVPMNADDYVHRIGRTGRAGKQGRAWTLATKSDDKYINDIQSLIKQDIATPHEGKKPLSSEQNQGAGAKTDQKPGRDRGRDKRQNQQHGKSQNKSHTHKSNTKKPEHKSHEAQNNQSRDRHDNKSDAKPQSQNKKSSQNEDDKVLGFGDDIPGFF